MAYKFLRTLDARGGAAFKRVVEVSLAPRPSERASAGGGAGGGGGRGWGGGHRIGRVAPARPVLRRQIAVVAVRAASGHASAQLAPTPRSTNK